MAAGWLPRTAPGVRPPPAAPRWLGETLPAMSQEHAERGEVGVGQVGQDLAVDGIVAKCLLVLLKAQVVQKARDVHALRPPTNPEK